MVTQSFKVVLFFLMLTSPFDSSMASPQRGDVDVLYADFNGYVPGSSLGQGGAVMGEPVSLGGLDTTVIETSPGENHLLVENNAATNNALRMRWEFLNDAEITEDLVVIAFEFTPNALDNYSFLVREHGSSTENFLNVNFTIGGNLIVQDESGTIALNSTTYIAGEMLEVMLIFDMNTRTSMMVFNDIVMFSDRSHGIVNRGVGTFHIGDSGFTVGSAAFTLDNLIVTTSEIIDDVIFVDGFD